jgi:hypothetical protein
MQPGPPVLVITPPGPPVLVITPPGPPVLVITPPGPPARSLVIYNAYKWHISIKNVHDK